MSDNDWVDMIGSVDLFDSDVDSVCSADIAGYQDPINAINNSFFNYRNCFKIAHLNARSLPRHFDEVSRLVINTDFDIISLSESWLNKSISNNNIKIAGYKMFRRDRAIRGGGGVCMYVKDSYKSKVININYNNSLIEVLFVELVLKYFKVVVGVLYRPPSVSYTVFSDLLPLINNLQSCYSNIVFTGDFNVDMFVDSSAKKII